MSGVTAAQPRNQRSQRGSVLVETAIILPLALFIIAGILDFGYIFQRSTIIYQASRAAARTAGAMTTKQSPANNLLWCSNAPTIGGTQTCDLILGGNFPLPDVGYNIPLKSGLYMACHYVREAGLDPIDWEATVTGPVRQVEDSNPATQMAWISITVRRAPTAERCLFCVQQYLYSLILDETSIFPVQCAT